MQKVHIAACIVGLHRKWHQETPMNLSHRAVDSLKGLLSHSYSYKNWNMKDESLANKLIVSRQWGFGWLLEALVTDWDSNLSMNHGNYIIGKLHDDCWMQWHSVICYTSHTKFHSNILLYNFHFQPYNFLLSFMQGDLIYHHNTPLLQAEDGESFSGYNKMTKTVISKYDFKRFLRIIDYTL